MELPNRTNLNGVEASIGLPLSPNAVNLSLVNFKKPQDRLFFAILSSKTLGGR
jgi:hypothetical protein